MIAVKINGWMKLIRYAEVSGDIMKGLTLAMQLLITAIVLVLTALTVLLITQTKLIQGPAQVEKEGNIGLCKTDRNVYCQDNPNGCWDSSLAMHKGSNCKEIMERPDDSYLYNCREGRWFNSTEHVMIKTRSMNIKCSAY